LRMRMPEVIQCCSFVESDNVDNQRLTIVFVVTNGVTHPQMGSIEASRTGMGTSVHIDFTPDMRSTFVDDEDALFRRDLDDFHWIRRREHARAARRRTHTFR